MSVKPIIPWIGGKRRLCPDVLPLLGEHRCYVEPFCGAAAVFFAKEPSPVEIINDLNGELVNLYRVVKHHLEEFMKQFRWALTARQSFLWHQAEAPQSLTDIQRAARFFYLQKLSFGAKVSGQTFGTATTAKPRLNLLRLEEDLSAAHLRLAQATIEHLPWADCIQRYDRPHTAFYCDPPYWETEGYGTPFDLDQYERLATIAKTTTARIVISINDHPQMRTTFAGLKQRRLPITYTVAGGKRSVARHELLLWNR